MIGRMAFLIAGVTAVVAGLVHIRCSEMEMRHALYTIERQRPVLRRELWDCQAVLGWKTTPQAIRENLRKRSIDMAYPSSSSVLTNRGNDLARGEN